MNGKSLGTLAWLAVMACTGIPTEVPRALGSDPGLAVSDPPPPPADGVGFPCGAPDVGCPEEGDPGAPPVLTAKYFHAPAASVAFATFVSFDPRVTISSNARVRDFGKGVIGSGTITTPVLLTSSGPLVSVIIQLSSATGSLEPDYTLFPVRTFEFTANAVFTATGLPVETPILLRFHF